MSETANDDAGAVRTGEELDLEKLEPVLRERIPELGDAPLELQQFRRGHSNLTYLLRAGDRELVLRRPPFGAKNIRAGHDMGREFRVLSRLHAVWSKAPRPYFFCEEGDSPLEAPFYAMERKHGVILRSGAVPKGVDLPPERMRRLSEALVDTLVELHGIDYEAAGLGDFGRPEGYVTRQVTGWTERYARSRTDDIPQMDEVGAWVSVNIPPEGGAALIHNDFKYDNVVLDPADPTRIVAVLDWEMATLGDPAADLGTSLAYWIDPDDPDEARALPLGSTTLPGNLTRAEVVGRYAERRGGEVPHVLFHYVNALYKVAVVAQQIYYRYAKGFTRDERFAMFIYAVRILAGHAARALERGRISGLG